MKTKVFIIIIVFILGACATASRMSNITPGMTRSEVINILGRPISTSSNGASEYLNYRMSETSDDAFNGILRPYYVEIQNGKVTTYGQRGDFQRKQIDVDMNIK